MKEKRKIIILSLILSMLVLTPSISVVGATIKPTNDEEKNLNRIEPGLLFVVGKISDLNHSFGGVSFVGDRGMVFRLLPIPFVIPFKVIDDSLKFSWPWNFHGFLNNNSICGFFIHNPGLY